MFPEHSDVAVFGLALGEAAVIRSREAERCAFCNVPPLDIHASDSAKLAWVNGYDPELAAAAREQTLAPAGHEETGRSWRDELRRVAWDSQLEPTLPLPADNLEAIVEQCDDDMREFLCDRLVFAVCGTCRAREIPPAHVRTSDRNLHRCLLRRQRRGGQNPAGVGALRADSRAHRSACARGSVFGTIRVILQSA